jgi:hypothetical protein
MREDSKLSASEIAALKQVGGMMARVLPKDIKDSLVSKGLIEQKLGGLARTAKGEVWLKNYDR